MTTLSQEYAALSGSAEAAALHARTIVEEHQPDRAEAAAEVVRLLVADALARTPPGDNVGLVTIVGGGVVRFEVRDPDLVVDGAEPPFALLSTVSTLADRFGDGRVREGAGHMAYAEIFIHADAPDSCGGLESPLLVRAERQTADRDG
ncbi:hypothetical protein [Acrocarpospora sp. B8E8]|uniref:hypothetical protein n=1 Tax=Acrocarpospora sp. B8E8 TaxID=3153572 RepID=UPI00325CA586